MTNRTRPATALVFSILWATLATEASIRTVWTTAQLEELRSMSLTELEPLPSDPTSRVADDPRAADLRSLSGPVLVGGRAPVRSTQ